MKNFTKHVAAGQTSPKTLKGLRRFGLALSLFLYFGVAAFAQEDNDFRTTAAGGPWNSASTWERFVGIWVPATFYPGEQVGANKVTILPTATVTIPTAFTTAFPFGDLIVNGPLKMSASSTLSTTNIFINGPSGNISWDANNVELTIPTNSAVIYPAGYVGLVVTGSCNNTKKLLVGIAPDPQVAYSCQGGGNSCLIFADANAQGGTFSVDAAITVQSEGGQVCTNTFDLSATVTGVGATGATITWSGTGPGTITFNPTTGATTTATVSAPGTYTIKIEATNTVGGTNCTQVVKDDAFVDITINPSASATLGSGTSVCIGQVANVIVTNTTSPQKNIEVFYNINGGPAQSLVVIGPIGAIPVPTGTAGSFTVTLDSAKFTTSPFCKANLTGSAVVTVTNPTALGITGSNDLIDYSTSTRTVFRDNSCRLIATVTPNGSNPVTGIVIANKWVEPGVVLFNDGQFDRPLSARHVDISPVTPSPTSTARVTLYYLQSEFDAINAAENTGPEFPTGPADLDGISHVRILKFTGGIIGGSGLPADYASAPIIIDPNDADIVWNAANGWWEVSFNVTGFSGFFAGPDVTIILPMNLISFNGRLTNTNNVELYWRTTEERNVNRFEIEYSADGRSFGKVSSINARNAAAGVNEYTYNTPMKGKVAYFRLKTLDKDGKATYSTIVKVDSKSSTSLSIFPNPARDRVNVELRDNVNGSIRITDLNGKMLMQQRAVRGMNSVDVNRLPLGTYILELVSDGGTTTNRSKFVKN